jgi:hypothetical protein
VCYYGPEKLKPRHVKYAVYRPESNGTEYHLVPDSGSHTTLSGRTHDSRRSISRDNGQLLTGGFHCYEQSLDTHIFVEEGNVVGACVVNPKGMMKQLNIVSRVSGQPPDSTSVQLHGTQKDDIVNLCKNNKPKDTNFPLMVDHDQLSAVNSTRLHLSANITCTAIGKYTSIISMHNNNN